MPSPKGKKEGGGLLRIKGLDLKWTSLSLQIHFLEISRPQAVCISIRGSAKSGIWLEPRALRSQR